MHIKLMFLLLFIFILSCQSNHYNKKQQAKIISSSVLYNTQWVLHQSYQKTLSVFLKLTADGKVRGFSGCNKFFGKISLSDNKISFARLATTRKMCPKIMEFESGLISGLSSINNYKIEASANLNKLYLYNEQTEVFVFTSNKAN